MSLYSLSDPPSTVINRSTSEESTSSRNEFGSLVTHSPRFSPLGLLSPSLLSSTPSIASPPLLSRQSSLKLEEYEVCIEFSVGNPVVETMKGWMILEMLETEVDEKEKPEEEGALRLADLEQKLNDAERMRSQMKKTSHSNTNMVCLLDVPAGISIGELFQFCSSFSDSISHMQIVRKSLAKDSYCAWIRFHTPSQADEFRQVCHARPFNSLEADLCVIQYMTRVEPLGLCHVAFPAKETEELSCPVCLDRIVAMEMGMIVSLCQHVFHLKCLAKWTDSKCPVCRYIMQPDVSSECLECGTVDDLWICLICGFVGCGRYTGGHAVRHFEETAHNFAQEVLTQRVWDYVRDGYVHRLLQSMQGKPVELIQAQPEDASIHHDLSHQSSLKLELVLTEYNYLLASQMEKQRVYFQERLVSIEKEKKKAIKLLDAQCADLSQKIEGLSERKTRTQSALQTGMELTQVLETTLNETEQDTRLLRMLNEKLLAEQKNLQSRMCELEERLASEKEQALAERDEQIAQLQEQLQDLSFYLKTQRTIENSGLKNEIESGQVIMMNDIPAEHGRGRPHSGRKPKRRGAK